MGRAGKVAVFSVRFEQGNGFFVGIVFLGFQQPDFVEQGPHVGRGVVFLFGLPINGFHQRRGRGRLVLFQQRVNFLPLRGVRAGRRPGAAESALKIMVRSRQAKGRNA